MHDRPRHGGHVCLCRRRGSRKAGFTSRRDYLADVPAGAYVTRQDPAPGTMIGKTDQVQLSFSTPTTPTTTAPPAPARKITARDWALIAKNPDAHKGERIIVYGLVTQFDAATGNQGFRANVDGVVHPVKYGFADYETNTILGADVSTIANVVKDDLFQAEVTVVGSYSYGTQLGGQTTAPKLFITSIKVTGSVAG